jgi:hypothetical protein
VKSGVVLCNTGLTAVNYVGSSTIGNVVSWQGGRSVLVFSADTYGGNVFLVCQGPNGKWIKINGSTYAADQVTAYDLPSGQYQLVNQASSTLNVSAALVTVAYGD